VEKFELVRSLIPLWFIVKRSIQVERILGRITAKATMRFSIEMKGLLQTSAQELKTESIHFNIFSHAKARRRKDFF
jgi:hypothetical protein